MRQPPFQLPDTFNVYDYFLGDRLREGAGSRTAVRLGDRRVSYEEIEALSRGFEAHLRDAGVAPGDRVIIALPDGERYVAALFGILRAGAVVVMLNPGLPEEEVR